MIRYLIPFFLLFTLFFSNLSFADTMEQRLEKMEKRILYLENQIKSQEAKLKTQEASLEKRDADVSKLTGSVLGRTNLSGALEMSIADTSGSSSGQVDKIELVLETEINPNVSTEIVLLTENDSGTYDTQIDTAAVTLAVPNTDFNITLGKFGPSMASLETALQTDPLTKTEADISYSGAIEVSTEMEGIALSAFAEETGAIGGNINLSREVDAFEFNLNIGYTSELASTTAAGGYAIGTTISTSNFTVNAEYLEADGNAGGSQRLNAFNIDLSTDIGAGTFAVGYGDSISNAGAKTEQTLFAYSIGLGDGVSLTLEHADETDTTTAAVAVEF